MVRGLDSGGNDYVTVEEMARITADDFGIRAVESIGLPQIVNQDGPDCIRGNFKIGKKNGSTLYNNVSQCVATWNQDLIRLRGYYIGEEGIYMGVSQYWGPGCNMHRTPYGGRSYEYMSEDPILSYYAIAPIVEAMQAKGLICAPKHLCGNDQETNRGGVMTFMTEQTLREVTLKAFESAYTQGHTKSTMTSYNAIGPCFTARNYALMEEVARGEWGHDGIFITDAGSCTNTPITTIASGTDMFCLDGTMDGRVVSDLKDDYGLAALKETNKRFYYCYANSLTVNGLESETVVSNTVGWWEYALYGCVGLAGLLALLSLAGFVWFAYIKKEGKVNG